MKPPHRSEPAAKVERVGLRSLTSSMIPLSHFRLGWNGCAPRARGIAEDGSRKAGDGDASRSDTPMEASDQQNDSAQPIQTSRMMTQRRRVPFVSRDDHLSSSAEGVSVTQISEDTL